MDKKEIQKQIDELGIVTIEASGELSSAIVEDAIDSTRTLLQHLDLETISAEINEKERSCL